MDLLPVGIYQFKAVTDHGLWFARSSAFIDSTAFQTFTWMRMLGGAIFTLGGVIPLVWFVTSRRKGLKKSIANNLNQPINKERMAMPVG
jgi:nitric oxide reductase subunit B